jgi:DNA replication and repair protein RecF
MRITKLWLINFRNHENTVISFADTTVIIGVNGAGKTSALEAIDILTTSRSRIVKGINKCIKNQQQGFIITGQFDSLGTIVFKQEQQTKTIKINDDIIPTTSAMIGKVNSVIFLPGDIELIQGAPSIRRKYLDMMISQVDHEYYEIIQKYQRALKQRNELLKAIKHQKQTREQLLVWDKQLAELNAVIHQRRSAMISLLSKYMAELYAAMGLSDDIRIKYETETSADVENNLQKLTAAQGYDVLTGHTSFGIHGDDSVFYAGEIKASEFCSQGQQRMISVTLKCAEARIKQERLNDPPILLIDDVLLELDMSRFNTIIQRIAPNSQKIFTVTDTRRFDSAVLATMHMVQLDRGKVV